MSTGPIEFLSDAGPAHEVPDTEFGGADGLIQPMSGVRLEGDPEASGGHDLEGGKRQMVREVAGVMMRAASEPLTGSTQVTGVPLSEDVIDPVTGREAPTTINKTGGGDGELSDLAPY